MRSTSARSRLPLASLLLLAAPLAGCGEAPPAPAASLAVGPHGGAVLELPGRAGVAEVVVEPAAAGRGGRAAKAAGPASAVLAVYLFGPDMASPPAVAPAKVAASVVTPESPAPRAVTLRARPSAKPADGLRFASEPGPYDFDELRGEVTLTLGGTPATLPFRRP